MSPKPKYPVLSNPPTEAEVLDWMEVAEKRFKISMEGWEWDTERDAAGNLLNFMAELFERAEAKQR